MTLTDSLRSLRLLFCRHERRRSTPSVEWGRSVIRWPPCHCSMYRWQKLWDWRSLNSFRVRLQVRYGNWLVTQRRVTTTEVKYYYIYYQWLQLSLDEISVVKHSQNPWLCVREWTSHNVVFDCSSEKCSIKFTIAFIDWSGFQKWYIVGYLLACSFGFWHNLEFRPINCGVGSAVIFERHFIVYLRMLYTRW